MDPGPTAAEHVFVLVFAVIYPAVGYFSFRRLLRRVAAGHSPDRPGLYLHTVVGQWLMVGVGLLLWLRSARPLDDLGLSLELAVSGESAIAVLVTAAGIALLMSQVRMARGADRRWLDAANAAFGTLRHLMPRTPTELRWFYAVALTAGIAEEILWRGYLLPYLGRFFDPATAALLAVVGFGVAHAYQGLGAIPKVTLVGGIFLALYLLSGSLWLSMLLHAAVDLLQGRMAYDVFVRRRVYAGETD